jgi:hypothetical protein
MPKKKNTDVDNVLPGAAHPPTPEPVTMSHEKAIAIALNNVMREVTYVQKGGKVAFGSTKYSYASEADFLQVARPAMVKHGLSLLPSCTAIERDGDKVYVKLEYKLLHISGAIWPYELSMWGCGADRGDKAIYKAETGANKYMLFKLLQVPTGDDPESGKQPEEQPPINNVNKETPYVMPSKDKVMKNIMQEFPGASKQASENRLAALNQNLLAVGGNIVESPDKVTDSEWAKIARSMQ